jgi:hypothetical protein
VNVPCHGVNVINHRSQIISTDEQCDLPSPDSFEPASNITNASDSHFEKQPSSIISSEEAMTSDFFSQKMLISRAAIKVEKLCSEIS